MKTLGLFLFILSLNSYAGGSLFLRAQVPSTYQVKFDHKSHKNPVIVITNQKQAFHLPRLEVKQTKDIYLVSITHP